MNILKYVQKKRNYDIGMFIQRRFIIDENARDIKNNPFPKYWYEDKRIELTDKNNGEVGYIQYTPHTGQIGLLDIIKNYRNHTLGTQLLTIAINDIKQNNTNVEEVWAVTIPNHPFWSKIMKFKPRDPV